MLWFNRHNINLFDHYSKGLHTDNNGWMVSNGYSENYGCKYFDKSYKELYILVTVLVAYDDDKFWVTFRGYTDDDNKEKKRICIGNNFYIGPDDKDEVNYQNKKSYFITNSQKVLIHIKNNNDNIELSVRNSHSQQVDPFSITLKQKGISIDEISFSVHRYGGMRDIVVSTGPLYLTDYLQDIEISSATGWTKSNDGSYVTEKTDVPLNLRLNVEKVGDITDKNTILAMGLAVDSTTKGEVMKEIECDIGDKTKLTDRLIDGDKSFLFVKEISDNKVDDNITLTAR